MTTEEAIKLLEGYSDKWGNMPAYEDMTIRYTDELDTAIYIAISALRAQQEAEKNEPLTLDELREMEGEAIPVWCDKVNGYVFIATTKTEPYNQVWFFNHKGFAYTVLYYHTKFYRRKPEETI